MKIRQNVPHFALDHILALRLARTISRPTTKDNEETMVPRRVVPHVLLEELLHVWAFARPQPLLFVKVREDPLTVGPRVVVLGVFLKDALEKVELARGGVDGVERGEEQPAVVPHLVRLQERGGDLVHPRELLLERDVERDHGLVPVLPWIAWMGAGCTSGVGREVCSPGSVMCGVHPYYAFGELKHSLAHLSRLQDSAEVVGRILVCG